MHRPIHRALNSGLPVVLLLVLIAAAPFLTRPGLPRGTDAELHVFRAAELGYSLRAGVLYPRWAPDFYYGYGYPIFNYYAPLTYYLANGLALLPGLGIVAGVKAVFVLGFFLAGLGSYLAGRDLTARPSPLAGILAAALYLFSPYILFIDPHARGDLAEFFALGLFPLVFWAFWRLLPPHLPSAPSRRPGWGGVVLAALLLAALILSHNLMALVGAAVLLVSLAWTWIARRCPPAWGGRLLAAFLLGLALSAFFWLPVLLEKDAVHLSLVGPGHFDFRNHFRTLAELLAPSAILDFGATAPHYRYNLGLAPWMLALGGVLLFLRNPRTRGQVALAQFPVGAVLLIFLMLPASTPIWERVPGMAYLQFPWRLLGMAAFALALTAAIGLTALTEQRRAFFLTGLALVFILVAALPTMFPPLWDPDFGPTDPQAMLDFELAGIALGTTSTGDFLPSTVEVPPGPQESLIASYRRGGPVDKVNRATLPRGTTVEIVAHGPTYDRFRVRSAKKFILRLYTFYFPGWRALVDGEEVPIELGRPEGFITIPIPPGEHEVLVVLGTTPVRRAATFISALALAVLIFLSLLGRLPWRSAGRPTVGEAVDRERRPRSGRPAPALLLLVPLLFWGFKVGVVDPRDNWFRITSPPGEVVVAQHRVEATFGGEIALLGYDLPVTSVRAGESFPITLYWRAVRPPSANYQVFVHLVRPVYRLWGQSDKLNPGDFPTTRWPTDRYVWDDHRVPVLPGTPPGTYRIAVGLYLLAEGTRLPLLDEAGRPVADLFLLPTPVQVERGRPPDPARLEPEMEERLETTYGGQITLLGYRVPYRQLRPGDRLYVTLFWRAEVDGPAPFKMRLQVTDAGGKVLQEMEREPTEGSYPPDRWRRGEIVRDQPISPVGDDLPPGRYGLRLVVEAGGLPSEPIPLGALEIGGR